MSTMNIPQQSWWTGGLFKKTATVVLKRTFQSASMIAGQMFVLPPEKQTAAGTCRKQRGHGLLCHVLLQAEATASW